jgi:hypothetical protein
MSRLRYYTNIYSLSTIMRNRYAILAVISLLSVALVYSSPSKVRVFAVPPDSGWGGSSCTERPSTVEGVTIKSCCWSERAPGIVLPVQNQLI